MEIAWSGTLERLGLCPPLSSYIGPSQLHVEETRAERVVEPIYLEYDRKRVETQRRYREKQATIAARRRFRLKQREAA